ncbi:GDSL-type esterase/lipase family protein [Arthrobacter sp. CG_A4]|uniref:GDSL-type esterase/lipase family protein n=1 Tax=Arthrobacter sp. CG_A4 TaxID=3071706 RepID=UPI002E0EA79F
MRRRTGRLAGVVAVVALAAGFTAAPATAAPAPPAPVYIALGDSYAAGTGGGGTSAPPAGLPATCLQTAASYPAVRNAALNLGCFGATTADVAAVATLYAPALAAATVVTVTVGGNDVDSGQVALACTASASSPACSAALYNSVVVKLRQLPARIKTMLATIRTKAPDARIVLTGYPRLFTVNAGLSAAQQQAAKAMNSAADLLNATIAYSALVNRVRYVSVTERFNGHGIGSANPWIVAPTGLCNLAINCSPSPFDAFHPTAAGYSGGYAAALESARVP